MPFLAAASLARFLGYALEAGGGSGLVWTLSLSTLVLIGLSRQTVARLRTRAATSAQIILVLVVALATGYLLGLVTGQLNPATQPAFSGRLLAVALCFATAMVLPWTEWAQAGLIACVYAIDVAFARVVLGDVFSLMTTQGVALPIAMMASVLATHELRISRERRDEAENELRAARDVAEQASRAKGAFLANMSHEIRSPMNVVLGMLEMVLDSDLTDGQRHDLGRARAGALGLLGIINDVLDASKIEAGKLDLESVEMDLPALLRDTVDTLSPSAAEKGLTIELRIDHDVPRLVRGDPVRFRQIVVNLLGNAIKFTAQGGVVLDAAQVGTGGRPVVHVTVRDTGIGMELGTLGRIFEPFEQGDVSTTRSYGGSGLGLAISRQLVGLMGGRIWAESEPGRGSTFHFTVRFAQPRSVRTDGPRGDDGDVQPIATRAA